jgi:hypothetical protein
MRQHRSIKALHHPRPFAASGGSLTMLRALGEQHLHSDADAEHRPGTGQPAADQHVAPDRPQPGHAGGERAHSRHHEAVTVHRGIEVGAHLSIRASPLQGPLRRAEIA